MTTSIIETNTGPSQTSAPPHRGRGYGFTVALLAVACVAMVLMVLATRWGVALSSDSARYVRTARNVYGSGGTQVDTGEPKHEQAHFPPFYPIVLATGAKLTRTDPAGSAHWLHILIFGANVLLTGLILRRFGAAPWAALLAALAVALAPVSIFIHSWLLSEPLFILLSLLTIWLLVSHLERPRLGVLVGAAAAASLGMMTRYAGAAIAPAAVLALLLIPGRRRWKGRALDAALFAAIFAILPVANTLRNLSVGGSATNRALAYHPITVEHLKDGIAVLASWAAPLGVTSPRERANAHPLLGIAGVLGFAAILAASAISAWRRRSSPAGALASVALLYFGSFLALLIFSISFVDFHTPADERVLSPLFVAWVILASCAASAAAASLRPTARAAVIAGCFGFAALSWVPSVRLVARLYREGDGFAHAQWQQSPTIAAVKDLPPDEQVFTNAPGAVYLLTKRQFILTIPSEINASSRLPNPEYAQLMSRITTEMQAGRGVLVWLRRYGAHRAFYPTEHELRRKLGLHPVAWFSDGAIYDLAPTTQPTTGMTTAAATTRP